MKKTVFKPNRFWLKYRTKTGFFKSTFFGFPSSIAYAYILYYMYIKCRHKTYGFHVYECGGYKGIFINLYQNVVTLYSIHLYRETIKYFAVIETQHIWRNSHFKFGPQIIFHGKLLNDLCLHCYCLVLDNNSCGYLYIIIYQSSKGKTHENILEQILEYLYMTIPKHSKIIRQISFKKLRFWSEWPLIFGVNGRSTIKRANLQHNQ